MQQELIEAQESVRVTKQIGAFIPQNGTKTRK